MARPGAASQGFRPLPYTPLPLSLRAGKFQEEGTEEVGRGGGRGKGAEGLWLAGAPLPAEPRPPEHLLRGRAPLLGPHSLPFPRTQCSPRNRA